MHRALHDLDWRTADYFFIENVGNLVCPAVYDLGQHFNVVALAVTEGEDKPLKYPLMFRKADLVLLTKADRITSYNVCYTKLLRVTPSIIPMSAPAI